MTAAHCVVADDANGDPISTALPITKFEVVLGRSDLSKGWQGDSGGAWVPDDTLRPYVVGITSDDFMPHLAGTTATDPAI
jgi:hypothetical protein